MQDVGRRRPAEVGLVTATERTGQVVDVDDRAFGHPRASVLAAPGVPVDPMERGDESALFSHRLAQVSPTQMQAGRSADFHDDLGW
jgi:hypothetical protein